jgi:hypothetical protein
MLLSHQAYAFIEPYTKVFDLHIYQIVEREGECNIFVNGFNEQIKVCPDYLKEKEDATR